jgi:methylase of polypeptide subunit release factors
MEDNKKYIENLQALDFQIKDQDNSSVFFVEELEEYLQNGESPYIVVALDKAKTFEVDAVYFRFFDDERPPMPQLYIYDNITNPKPAEYYAQKHREIWSSCEIASFLVINKTTIKIFDSREPVKVEKDKINSKPIKELNLSEIDKVVKEFNAQSFDNGSFWESKEMKNHFLNSKIASERLVNGLKSIRTSLRENRTLSKELIDQLLIVCVLIKYLEETGIDKKNDINLAQQFFEEKTGYRKLEEIIYHNKLTCLLSALAEHFKGGIFNIEDKYIQELNDKNISGLAQFFEAGYKNNLFGWNEYSFEHIPVELISNFYEEFIPKTKNKEDKTEEKSKESTGAVYTPSFLVNLLIDECLPLDKNDLDENVKLLDPACGSGIFLVSAYKRLVQRWRIKNKNGNELAKTTPEILKEILTRNIFGVDINPKSVNLSIFSLQLALCSMLTPREIWTKFQFDDLKNNNIIERDFFEYLIDLNTKSDFDLVIGNPPFVQKELDGKSYLDYQTLLRFSKYPIKFNNPQKEFALLFLEKAMDLLKENTGRLFLILPSSPVLYAKTSLIIRKQLFSTYNVFQVIDFTFFRSGLFPSQTTITSLAICINKFASDDKPVLHIVAKRTKQGKEHFYFEFDHYDFHKVPKELVADKVNVWKCNLLGGLRICDMIDKFSKLNPKLRDYLYSNNINCYPDGIKKKHIFPAYEVIQENDLFSSTKKIPQKNENYFGMHHSIMKDFPIEVTINDFKNRDSFRAIGFMSHSTENIVQLKKYLIKHSDFIRFFIAAVSGRQGIRSPYTFYLSDMENFPFVENLEDYISDSDKIIIEDVVKYTLDEFGNGEKAWINKSIADRQTLIEFSQVYVDVLNVFYRSGSKRYTLTNIEESDAYFVCEIQYTDKDISSIIMSKTDKEISNLLFDWNPSQSKKVNKIIRSYGTDMIRIIKPKQLRYWLKSKALRDADETFNDILTH